MDANIKLLVSALGTVLFWGIVTAYVFFDSIPDTPVSLPFSESIDTKLFMPEGWSFFTRNPREKSIRLYKQADSKEWVEAIPRNADITNWFGLKRTSRSKGLEYGRLLSQLDRRMVFWNNYNGSLNGCLSAVADTLKAVNAENDMPNPAICGEILLVRSEPIPWAWRNAKNIEMPLQLLKLNISCE